MASVKNDHKKSSKNTLKGLNNFQPKRQSISIRFEKRSKIKYRLGQHGAKRREQLRLKVSGFTHESEHVIGYNSISGGLKRRSSITARRIENLAPAYQEEKFLHRAHIGTGNRSLRDSSGFNSKEYRLTQRSLLIEGNASSAVQINQLAYAHIESNRFQTHNSQASLKAQASYELMVKNMEQIRYKSMDDSIKTLKVDQIDRQEMLMARQIAKTGIWPVQEIVKFKKNIK